MLAMYCLEEVLNKCQGFFINVYIYILWLFILLHTNIKQMKLLAVTFLSDNLMETQKKEHIICKLYGTPPYLFNGAYC